MSSEQLSKAEKLALAKQKMKKFKGKKSKSNAASKDDLPGLSSSQNMSFSDDGLADDKKSTDFSNTPSIGTGSIEVLSTVPEKGPPPPIPARNGSLSSSNNGSIGDSNRPTTIQMDEIARLTAALEAIKVESNEMRSELQRQLDVAKEAFDNQLNDLAQEKDKELNNLAQQHEKTLREETENLLKKLSDLESSIAIAEGDKGQMSDKIMEIEESLSIKEQEKERLEEKIKELEESSAQHGREKENLRLNITTLEKTLQEKQNEIEETASKILELEELLLKKETELADLRKKLNEFKLPQSTDTVMDDKVNDLELALASMSTEKDNLSRKILSMDESLANALKAKEEVERKMKELEKDLLESNDEKANLLQQISERTDEIMQQKSTLDKALFEMEQIKNNFSASEQQRQELVTRLESMTLDDKSDTITTEMLEASEKENIKLQELLADSKKHHDTILATHQEQVIRYRHEIEHLQSIVGKSDVVSSNQQEFMNRLTLEKEQSDAQVLALKETVAKQKEKIEALLAITASRSVSGSRISLSPSLEFATSDPDSPQARLLSELEKTRHIFNRLKSNKEALEKKYTTLLEESKVLSKCIRETAQMANRIEHQLDNDASLHESVDLESVDPTGQHGLGSLMKEGADTVQRLFRINDRLERIQMGGQQPYLVYPLTPSKSSDVRDQESPKMVITGVSSPIVAQKDTTLRDRQTFRNSDIAAIIQNFHEEQRKAMSFVQEINRRSRA